MVAGLGCVYSVGRLLKEGCQLIQGWLHKSLVKRKHVNGATHYRYYGPLGVGGAELLDTWSTRLSER